MGRFLAGVAAALLLAAGGFFLWRGLAQPTPIVPPPRPLNVQAGSDAALSQPPQATEKTREERRFDRYDRNDDGRIARDEYLWSRRRAYDRLDADHDGKLSFEEYAVKTVDKFTGADADRSGLLTREEFATTRVVRKPRPAGNCVCAPAAPTEEE